MSYLNAQAALPSDPTIVSGDIGFSLPDAGHLNVNQTDATGIINWGSFSIGTGNTVSIQNGSGATLNRVTGSNASQILGTLNATGSVYLLNQNGVFFGENGIVQTGGDFVASTLDISNSDFLNRGDDVFAGNSTASVLNFGEIGSLGGNVALIARTVVNEGSIAAPNGTAALVAGREILMRDIALDNGMFVVRVGGDDTSITDRGSIRAATAELRANGGNIYALAGNTNGTIRATGVQKKGGRVFLTAAGGHVETDKTIVARHSDGAGGTIKVNAGTINASNLYDASALSGDGGFVELYATAETVFSGEILAFGDGIAGVGGFAEVSGAEKLSYTGSTNTGGGTLLLDPDNFSISIDPGALDGASNIDPTVLTNDLGLNNVIIQTSGADGEAGTIHVEDDVFYDSTNSLTLLAHGDIIIQAPIQNENTTGGDINIVSGWDGSTSVLAFDNTIFDAADLDNPIIFGNSSGDAYTLFGTGFTANGLTRLSGDISEVAVGSVGGNTRVYSRGLEVIAGESEGPSIASMIGARVDNSSMIGASPITGNIFIRASGSIDIEGGSQTDGFAQIGHVGSALSASGGTNSASASGNIQIETAGDITIIGGEGNGSYALIGHGSVDTCAPATCNQSAGTRQGDITVFAGGEVSLDDGFDPIGSPPLPILAWIGHGTTNLADVSNADIDIEAASFDQTSAATNNSGDLSRFSSDIITAGLNGGSFTLVASDTGLEFTAGEAITATDGTLLIDVANSLQFGTGFSIVDSGNAGQYVLSAAEQFINLEGDGLFDIGAGNWFIYSERPDLNTGGLGTLSTDTIVYGFDLDFDDPVMMNFRDDDGLPLNSNANTLVYSVDPQLTIDPVSYTYGQDDLFSPTFTFTVDEVDEDPEDFGFVELAFAPNLDFVTFSNSGIINAGSYANGVLAEFDIPVDDLYFGFEETAALTVTPATLTVLLADETKDTGFGYTGEVTYTGFIPEEDDSLITSSPTFSYDGGDGSDGEAPGIFSVSGSDSIESSGNYIFNETDTASLTIEEGGGIIPPDSTENTTKEITEVPIDQNPSSTNNQQATFPILVNGVDGFDGLGFLEVSTLNTDKLVNQLQRGKQFCEGLAQAEYVIDCMGDSLQKAADGLPEGGDYAAVRAALEDASDKLEALVRENASAVLTRGLVQSNGQQSSRRLTPVATEALALLNEQAAAIIEETQTILLRSSQNSERRKIHYQRIAAAVGSNKILLRSV